MEDLSKIISSSLIIELDDEIDNIDNIIEYILNTIKEVVCNIDIIHYTITIKNRNIFYNNNVIRREFISKLKEIIIENLNNIDKGYYYTITCENIENLAVIRIYNINIDRNVLTFLELVRDVKVEVINCKIKRTPIIYDDRTIEDYKIWSNLCLNCYRLHTNMINLCKQSKNYLEHIIIKKSANPFRNGIFSECCKCFNSEKYNLSDNLHNLVKYVYCVDLKQLKNNINIKSVKSITEILFKNNAKNIKVKYLTFPCYINGIS